MKRSRTSAVAKERILATIREYTREGLTVCAMHMSKNDYDALFELELEGAVVHAAFAPWWFGAKTGYIAARAKQ